MKALVLDAEACTANIRDIATPILDSTELLVQVLTISLNPIDPIYVRHPLASSGRTIGSDFAGVIVKVGSSVPMAAGYHEGDRIAGFLQGVCSANERPGAFAELVTIPWDLVWKVPTAVLIEEAASVSLVALTAAQAIWYRLGLKAPFYYDQDAVLEEHTEWKTGALGSTRESEVINFFIYGASTSIGLYAAQMVQLSAKASGRTIRLYGAASKARWDMLGTEPYNYDHLVDYRDNDWPEQVKKLSAGAGIHFAYDCISEGYTVQRVTSTLGNNGKIAIVRSRTSGAWRAGELPDEPIYGAVWEGLGEEVQYQGFVVKKSPAARNFAVAFYNWLGIAISSEIMVNPIRLMPGGLSKVVEDGFHLLGPGGMGARQANRMEEWMKPVSAQKLVYKLKHT